MMNHEESLLFTGGEDGLVMVWKVADREGRVKAAAEPPVFFEEVKSPSREQLLTTLS